MRGIRNTHMKGNRSNKSSKAFTLLELVVALVVLAVLAALAIPTYSSVIGSAKFDTAQATALSVATDATAIGSLRHSPPTAADLTSAISETSGVTAVGTPTSGTLNSADFTIGDQCVTIDFPGTVNAAPSTGGTCGSGSTGSDTPSDPPTTTPAGPTYFTVDMPTFSSFTPSAMATDSTYVWLASFGSNSVMRVDQSTGATSLITDASFDAPAAIYSNGTYAWVANAFGGVNNTGSVSQIDIATGVVTEIDSPLFNNLNYLVGSGNTLWLINASGGTNTTGSVLKLNTTTDAVTEIDSPMFSALLGGGVSNGQFWLTGNTPITGGQYVASVNTSTDAVAITSDIVTTGLRPADSTSGGTTLWLTTSTGMNSSSLIAFDETTQVASTSPAVIAGNVSALATDGTNVYAVQQGTIAPPTWLPSPYSLDQVNIATGVATTWSDPALYSLLEPFIATTNGAVWVYSANNTATGNPALIRVTP